MKSATYCKCHTNSSLLIGRPGRNWFVSLSIMISVKENVNKLYVCVCVYIYIYIYIKAASVV
jgi:hypothetical protein